MAAKYTIEVDADTCIGDQLCCEEAPNTFAINDDNIAYVISPEGDAPENILAAAQVCPVDAIKLVDNESNEQVWPEA